MIQIPKNLRLYILFLDPRAEDWTGCTIWKICGVGVEMSAGRDQELFLSSKHLKKDGFK